MVDHVKTLLLNLPAASSEGVTWVIDQSFVPVQIPSWLLQFREALFEGTGDVESMARRVDAVYRILCKPELSFAMEPFDKRESGRGEQVSTVFDFYASKAPSELDAVGSVMTRGNQNSAFRLYDGMPGNLSSIVSELGVISKSTPETVVSFAAAVLAYVIQLEAVRLRSLGRVSS